MKKVRVLNIQFDSELHTSEISAFRGAIIEKVGKESTLFHNHTGDVSYRYGYPLIQYKSIGKHAAIMCVDYGVDEIHRFFEQPDWKLNLNGREMNMKISRMNLNEFTMQVWDKMFDYSILCWLALNEENMPRYKAAEYETDRIELLENVLKSNIISFAKGIEWTVDKPIELKILKMNEPRITKYKNIPKLAFDLSFRTNVFLPNFIGLGKGVSRGFGTVKRVDG